MIEDFKQAMRLLTGAVTIITAGEGENVAGLTATAVCSLSMSPPRMLVCLNRAGASFAALSASESFCVNVLDSQAQPLAEMFAGRTGLTGAQKFASDQWVTDEAGAPRLADALCAIRCRLHSLTLMDTHAIVVGNVEGVWSQPDQAPLLYFDQAFRMLG